MEEFVQYFTPFWNRQRSILRLPFQRDLGVFNSANAARTELAEKYPSEPFISWILWALPPVTAC